MIDQLKKALIEGDSEDVWSSVSSFIQEVDAYPEEAKDKFSSKSSIEKIFETNRTIVVLRSARKDAENIDDSPTADSKTRAILSNYQQLKDQVETLLKEARIVENLKTRSSGTSWATFFLTQYYEAIACSGSLEDLYALLYNNLGMWDATQLRYNFEKQKGKLKLLTPVFEQLTNADKGFPNDLKTRLTSINNTILRSLECLYDKNMNNADKAENVLEYLRTLKKEMKSLYDQTVKRSVLIEE
jgi:hypothetical protein